MHIYLDSNSTTRMDPAVREAMIECYEADFLNPASQHQPGQRARRQIETARHSLVERLGAGRRDRLIFTSGGTEANNLALAGIAQAQLRLSGRDVGEIIISPIEHPSVTGVCDALAQRGFRIRLLEVDATGVCNVDALQDLITGQTCLVSLMLVNNETGVIQNVAEAAGICRQHAVPLHTDAVQAFGKMPVSFADLGISAMSLTAHKLHGPRGIGALLLGEDVPLQPILFGGFQQLGLRPGTEDVALATGFAKAAELATTHLESQVQQLRELRDLFEQTILAELPATVIIGANAERAPHTSNLSFCNSDEHEAINRQEMMMAADLAKVALSTGSACARRVQ